MALNDLTIGGVQKELKTGSLSLDGVINGADVATFTVRVQNRSWVPTLGAEVQIVEDTVPIHGGLIRTFDEQGPDGQPDPEWNEYRITSDSFNVFFQQRYVTDVFAIGTTIAQIATAFAAYLTGQQVTLSGSQVTGPSLTAPLDFSIGVRMDEALGRLTTQTGYFGVIDPARVFKLATAGTDAAPFNVVDGDGNHTGDIRVTRSRDAAQPDTVILKFGPNAVLDYTQPLEGDGVTDTFPLDAPIVGPIAPSSAGLVGYGVVDLFGTESLGGLTSPAIWLYDPVALTIQRTLGPVPNGEVFAVRYQAQYPQIIRVSASPAVPIEIVVDRPNITSRADAIAEAEAILAQAQTDAEYAYYGTYELGLRPGHTQTITAADRGLNGSYLVTEINAENDENEQVFRRNVTAILGTQYRGAASDIYRDWLEKGGGATSTSGPTPSMAIPGTALLVSVVRITDAQWKAAGAGGSASRFLMVAGPAANDTRVKPIAASIRFSNEAGVYGNVDPDYAGLHFICGGQRMSCGYYNDSATPVSKFSDLLETAHDLTFDVPIPPMDSIAGFVGSPQSSPASEQYVMGEDIASLVDSGQIDGASVYFEIFNNGAGAFTGGNGANGAKVTLYYVLEDMAPDWDVVASLVNSTSGAGHLGADAVSAPMDTTGASFIVVVASFSVTQPSIVDNKGNTYVSVGVHAGGFAAGHEVFVVQGTPVVGTNHIFTAGAGFAMNICVAAFTGVSPTFEDDASATSASASALNTGSLTPLQNGSLLIAGWSTNNNTGAADAAIDNGFQILENEPAVASSRVGCALAYLVQPTAAAINPQWSQPGASAVAASVSSFI